ncbi:hypothetical protein Q0N48_01945 [Corynebacterium ureicelerivorans]|uniref:hypothetical protein n=1 Tax=Corynebacterium ureicelerivorans TaxID=401472 RepID=UPI0026524E1F|nr:hypothetical protein [Corynebacterium ureicelerivorans]MDN8604777.1 hypothetical protein [Corynebacterium ureicelerivorans]
MPSKIAALALTAGLALPTSSVPNYTAIDQIPVVGQPFVQAYNQLPPQVKNVIRLPLPLTTPKPGKTQHVAPAVDVQAQLDRLVADVVGRHGGRATVAVGSFTAGDNRPEPAFSTMKVPLAIAALRQNQAFYPDAEAAVTRSDNPAAHRMFGQVPAASYEGVIREAGARTTTPAGYQMGTLWTTSDQAEFASGLRCVAGHEPVLNMMGRIVDYQHWGLGRIGGARYKGGWNHYEGGHLARQFGLIPGPNGDIAVAITAHSPKGYDGSFAMLDELANGLSAMHGDLPASRC